ncbi:DUF5682 family protein [Terriglobus albidus]|uniref:DUF5682 family protein n=1 Tax=Terriglobus albidus TaxID=1592106 RepID=UPI0021E072D2|nr:DUF5682 family protein [Terriglobus albidus]
MEDRVHLLGIRHHGPGSAVLLRRALNAIDPACVLIEGPPEADDLVRYAAGSAMKPPVALLLHAKDDPNRAIFIPFAEFSPEWQAMRWALDRERPVRFIDWPAGVSLAEPREDARKIEYRADPLDQLAEAAGYDDGEAFWDSLIEQAGGLQEAAISTFAAIANAMAMMREGQEGVPEEERLREVRREAFMRLNIRDALKTCEGNIAVVCGAWHVSALRTPVKLADDKAAVKDLPRVKVQATWVPWTDSRLSTRSGYGAGVLSPGWYRHLWSLYAAPQLPQVAEFAASWQAKTALALRQEGYPAPTASAIEAARLALSLAALRGLSLPALAEMRDASIATLCHGDTTAMALIHQKVYVGEHVGEIGDDVPQMPLARDLALWQKRTRLKPEDTETEARLDLRSEAGLLKSTLLHRLALINVPWGKLIEAGEGRGTFREVWMLRWVPELSVALAEALIYGVTIEQAAAASTVARAKETTSVAALTELIRAALVADLSDAATECIGLLQAAAIQTSDITDLLRAVVPLVQVLRYGSARKLPEEALRSLIHSLCVEVNAGSRTGSQALDEETSRARVQAMLAYDHALTLFGDRSLIDAWRIELGRMVKDEQVAPAVAGVSLRLLHDTRSWDLAPVSDAFSQQMSGGDPKRSGNFLEGFLSSGPEVMLQDQPLLHLIDDWLCALHEEDFVESLPLLRRSLSAFDSVSRRRLLEKVKEGKRETVETEQLPDNDNPAFQQALPLLLQILGMES